MILSNRLQAIAQYVPLHSTLADIGSDHALLPVYLVQTNQCVKAIAGELNEGPYMAAKKQVESASLQHQIEVRRGDGLSVITANEVDTVTIAGMGGNLIRSILENAGASLLGVKRLILQPNVGEETVRRWLQAHNWKLIDERMLQEDGRIYEIIVADRAESAQDAKSIHENIYQTHDHRCSTINEDWNYKMGPILLQRCEPLLIQKWHLELQKLKHVHHQLAHATIEEAETKKRKIQQQIMELEAILSCLQMDKP